MKGMNYEISHNSVKIFAGFVIWPFTFFFFRAVNTINDFHKVYVFLFASHNLIFFLVPKQHKLRHQKKQNQAVKMTLLSIMSCFIGFLCGVYDNVIKILCITLNHLNNSQVLLVCDKSIVNLLLN